MQLYPSTEPHIPTCTTYRSLPTTRYRVPWYISYNNIHAENKVALAMLPSYWCMLLLFSHNQDRGHKDRQAPVTLWSGGIHQEKNK